MASAVQLELFEELSLSEYTRDSMSPPSLRSDCLPGGRNAARPCPWDKCRHYNEYDQTCVLDLADNGALTLEQIGVHMGLTRERVRQIEKTANERLRRRLLQVGVTDGQYVHGVGSEAPAEDYGSTNTALIGCVKGNPSSPRARFRPLTAAERAVNAAIGKRGSQELVGSGSVSDDDELEAERWADGIMSKLRSGATLREALST